MVEKPAAQSGTQRFASIDAYRGFVMFLMMAEALHLSKVAVSVPGRAWLKFLAHHQSHVEWRGCTLHDLIQPSFSLLVGVALPFSIASRLGGGQSTFVLTLHAIWRSIVLMFLGIFLRSVGSTRTNFTFEDTLTQIGLGYLPLFALGFASQRVRWGALVVILVGYWAAFALYPLPDSDFDYAKVGVSKTWPHLETGFAAHWNKNSNLAWQADVRFLNQKYFHRASEFKFNRGGYATLSFIPTLGTMLLGLIAGEWLRLKERPGKTIARLLAAAVVFIGIAMAVDYAGWCPIVKRIWTPTWTLYSGGLCFALLAFFYATTDAIGFPGWSYPLRVIGANSIAAYCMSHLIENFLSSSFRTHLGQDVFNRFGSTCSPVVEGGMLLATYWLILWWMYRNRIFVRI